MSCTSLPVRQRNKYNHLFNNQTPIVYSNASFSDDNETATESTESTESTCSATSTDQIESTESAGSAGMTCSMDLVVTAITPIGIPPSFARPVTTVFAHPPRVSIQESLSKNPEIHFPSTTCPAIMFLGSYCSSRTSLDNRKHRLFHNHEQSHVFVPLETIMDVES